MEELIHNDTFRRLDSDRPIMPKDSKTAKPARRTSERSQKAKAKAKAKCSAVPKAAGKKK